MYGYGHEHESTNLATVCRPESNTLTDTGGGLIKSHFWLEIPLKLDHQTIQALVCDS